jgi:hypothetical protein
MCQGDVADKPTGPTAAGTARAGVTSRGRRVRIGILLVARWGERRGDGRGDDAGVARGQGSLMRHILAPASIASLAGRVVDPTAPAPLIPPTRGVQGRAPGPVGAAARAVAIASIADPAQEEHLPTVDAGADHKTKRVHQSLRVARKGVDTRAEVCELWSLGPAESRPPRFGPRVRRDRASGPSPSRRPGANRSTLSQPAEATGCVCPVVGCPESCAFG